MLFKNLLCYFLLINLSSMCQKAKVRIKGFKSTTIRTTSTIGFKINVFKTASKSTTRKTFFKGKDLAKRRVPGVIAVARNSDGEIKFETLRVHEWSYNNSCPDLPNLQFPADLSVGALFQGRLKICGGIVHSATRACHSYDPFNNVWKKSLSLIEARYSATGIVIPKTGAWLITGGLGLKEKLLKSTEVFEKLPGKNVTVSAGPSLPEPNFGHCLVQLNPDETMMIGGVSDQSQFPHENCYRFIWKSGRWKKSSNLQFSRAAHSCGVVNAGNGQRLVVVAGGVTNTDFQSTVLDMDWEGESFLDSSEIYDPARDEWTLGPKLPRGLAGATPIVVNGILYLVGGTFYLEESTEIFKFNLQSGWESIPHRPQTPPGTTQGAGFFLKNAFCQLIRPVKKKETHGKSDPKGKGSSGKGKIKRSKLVDAFLNLNFKILM